MSGAEGHAAALARWREALLADPDLSLPALARQYLGGRSQARSREAILSELSDFLAAQATGEAALGLLDGTDSLILGAILAVGSLGIEDLAAILSSELSWRGLEYRLANLQERLLVYKAGTGDYEPAPQIASVLARGLDEGILYGAEISEGRRDGEGQRLSVQELTFLVLCLVEEGKELLLKDGGLSARGRRRVLDLAGGDSGAGGAAAFLIETFLRLGLVERREGGLTLDRGAAGRLLGSGGEELAYILAAVGAGLGMAGGAALKAALGPFLSRRFAFSDRGFRRFCALSALSARREAAAPRGSLPEEAAALGSALLALGLVEDRGGEGAGPFLCLPERAGPRWGAAPREDGGGRAEAAFALDGSGGIQVLPPASVQSLLLLSEAAELVSASGGWRFRLTKVSARRAFAAGWSVPELVGELERGSGRPLPQSLAWDLESWRTEYDAVRLFRGQTLMLDKAAADLVERSGAFARLPHETLGGGLYFFGPLPLKVISDALAAVGLPLPSLRSGLKERRWGGRREGRDPDKAEAATSRKPSPAPMETRPKPLAAGPAAQVPHEAAPRDPKPELEAELAHLVPDPAERGPWEEMLERKLVYTVDQLRAMVEKEKAPARGAAGAARRDAAGPGGASAAGLDFHGKLRVIQASFKLKYARLELRWNSGGRSLQAVVRPVALRRTERDYELEGEDLATGSPLSLRVGAMTYVGLKKGYYLGDAQ